MRKAFGLSFGLLLAGLICLAQAQVPMTGAGKASSSGTPTVYQGPGDVAPNAVAWWGLRCYTTAYTGNIADIYSPSDALHTLLTCSIGGGINETITPLATTCAVSCTVQTLYDQSGTNACSSAACDATQATEATRPTLTISCQGGRLCMEAAGAQDLIVTVGLSSPQSQPNFVSAVAYRASGNAYFGDSGNGTSIGYSGANTAAVYSGATLTQAATDSTWHTIQTTTNGGSSEIIVDARPGGTGAAGTGTISGSMKLIGDYFGNLITGKVGEIGLWNGANVPGTTPIDNLNSQQHTYWGF